MSTRRRGLARSQWWAWLVALVVMASPVRSVIAQDAQLASSETVDEDYDASEVAIAPSWGFDFAALRFAVFQQEGRGYQSQASDDLRGRGSEHAWIFQPILAFRVRQDESTTHDVVIPIDVVTAASPDALDAISTASRDNEAGSLDVTTTTRLDPETTLQLHYGVHFEEYWGTGFLGTSIARSLADDNAVARFGIEAIYDAFDALQPNGFDPGPVVSRFTSSVYASISQLLSPTTVVGASYTFTGQWGHLETTYNSVPTLEGGRLADRYPRQRGRHALTGELRQAIPDSGTYFALWYRFYADSFDAQAHSARFTVTQYVGDLWLRAHYRFHHQDAPSFWTTAVPADLPPWAPRTADSDLETLDAHELGIAARWFFERTGAMTATTPFLQLSYVNYRRTNSLEAHVGAVDFGYGF